MDVQFLPSVTPIVRDADAARSFFRDTLRLCFEGAEGGYLFTQKLEGTNDFGPWPLSESDTLIWNQRDLLQVLRECEAHHNAHPPHRSLKPPPPPVAHRDALRVHRHDRVGGVIYEYMLAA